MGESTPPRYVPGTTPNCFAQYGGKTSLKFPMSAFGTTPEHLAEFGTPSRASPTLSPPGPSVASDFITDMFGATTESPVWVTSLPNVRGDKPGEQYVATRIAETIDAHLRESDKPGRGLYFCTATVKAGATTRSKDTISELNSLYTDIDFKHVSNTPKEIETKLQQLQMPPSIVVHSGHGFHCYWLLNESIEATTESVPPFENILWLLADHLGGDTQCCEASRLMRLPGSHNTKNGEWGEVKVIVNRSLRYELKDLKEWLMDVAMPVIRRRDKDAKAPRDCASNKTGSTDAVEYDNPFLAYAASRDTHTPIDVEQRLADMRHEGADDTSVHITQRDVTRFLVDRGDPLDEIVARVLAATHRVPGSANWNWRVEERNIRDMAVTWGAKRAKEESEREQEQEQPQPQPKATSKPRLAIPAFSNDWCDVSKIPRRHWLYEQHYIRGFVTASIAPGGVGKSTKAIIDGICMASNRALLGVPVTEQVKIWYWNGEEPRHEIARRVHAVCEHYNIDPHSIADTFHFTSGLDEFPIKIVTATKKGITVNEALVADIVAFIRANDIGVMMIDPLISSHAVPENDNVAMDLVVKTWGRIAAQTDCDAELVHHTRKALRGEDSETLASDARGAGSLIDGVRASRVFNQMTEKEAGDFGVDDRSQYFRVNRGKTNMVIRGSPTWYKLVSVVICNGEPSNPQDGDNVHTVTAWTPPGAFDSVTTAHMHTVRARTAKGNYRLDARTTGLARWLPKWRGSTSRSNAP
jgi:hypothetical protein